MTAGRARRPAAIRTEGGPENDPVYCAMRSRLMGYGVPTSAARIVGRCTGSACWSPLTADGRSFRRRPPVAVPPVGTCTSRRPCSTAHTTAAQGDDAFGTEAAGQRGAVGASALPSGSSQHAERADSGGELAIALGGSWKGAAVQDDAEDGEYGCGVDVLVGVHAEQDLLRGVGLDWCHSGRWSTDQHSGHEASRSASGHRSKRHLIILTVVADLARRDAAQHA